MAEPLAPGDELDQGLERPLEELDGGRVGLLVVGDERGEPVGIDAAHGERAELGADPGDPAVPRGLAGAERGADFVGGGDEGRAEGSERRLEGVEDLTDALLRRHSGRAPC